MGKNGVMAARVMEEATKEEKKELLRVHFMPDEKVEAEFGLPKQAVLISIVKQIKARIPLNSLCTNCICLGVDCEGTVEGVYTGCIFRKLVDPK